MKATVLPHSRLLLLSLVLLLSLLLSFSAPVTGSALPTVVGEVLAELGCGWYLFNFGLADTFPRVKFILSSDNDFIMQVTDIQCPGDRFEIIDDGVPIYMTAPLSSSVAKNCTEKINSPSVAFEMPDRYSTLFSYIPAGNHNITIRVVESPYTCGVAAIRFDENYAGNDPRAKFGHRNSGHVNR
ncbi:hypothetical protein PSACC_01814 [Paramicrosporidium saccamoebae]|uniref:Uncharacterized protein n=1 Tax=Paramicrosporidium saccamoebae TaxID=1246581 RepID=A0A2H9TKX4_9FUNG|nr:hypothetical protein PSACC_01814 [Paramicrosporidium saccamoebae]